MSLMKLNMPKPFHSTSSHFPFPISFSSLRLIPLLHDHKFLMKPDTFDFITIQSQKKTKNKPLLLKPTSTSLSISSFTCLFSFNPLPPTFIPLFSPLFDLFFSFA